MIWVPCSDLNQVSNKKKNYISYEQIVKNKNKNFSKTAQPILMAKIYVTLKYWFNEGFGHGLR